MTLGVLSDCYLALSEIKNYGPVIFDNSVKWNKPYQCIELEDKNKFKYLNYTLNYHELNKLRGYVTGSFDLLFDNKGELRPQLPGSIFEITKEGEEYIKEDLKKRKTRFHIKSYFYFNAFINIIIGNKDGYSEFEKEIALTHNGVTKDNKLTRQGEKFLTSHLKTWLRNHLSSGVWNPLLGPNKILYSKIRENDFSDWKTTLEYDFKLANCVPGIAPLVVPELEEDTREYASILFLSNTIEEVIEKIKEKQKINPDLYIFCD